MLSAEMLSAFHRARVFRHILDPHQIADQNVELTQIALAAKLAFGKNVRIRAQVHAE